MGFNTGCVVYKSDVDRADARNIPECAVYPASGTAGASFDAAWASTMPIHLDNVDCYGDESGLHECERNAWGYHDCKHDQDVHLMCQAHPDGKDVRVTWLGFW